MDALKTKLREKPISTSARDTLLKKINEQAARLRDATRDEKAIRSRMKEREVARKRPMSEAGMLFLFVIYIAVSEKLICEKKKAIERNERLEGESKKDYLIRTGKITPFAKVSDEQDAAATSTTRSTAFLPGSGGATVLSRDYKVHKRTRSDQQPWIPALQSPAGSSSSHGALDLQATQPTSRKRKKPASDDEYEESGLEDEDEDESEYEEESESGAKVAHIRRKRASGYDDLLEDDGNESNYQVDITGYR